MLDNFFNIPSLFGISMKAVLNDLGGSWAPDGFPELCSLAFPRIGFITEAHLHDVLFRISTPDKPIARHVASSSLRGDALGCRQKGLLGKNLPSDESKRPDIGFLSHWHGCVSFSNGLHYFGRCIVWGRATCHRRLFASPRRKIDEFPATAKEHDAPWMQVTVHVAFAVHESHRTAYLEEARFFGQHDILLCTLLGQNKISDGKLSLFEHERRMGSIAHRQLSSIDEFGNECPGLIVHQRWALLVQNGGIEVVLVHTEIRMIEDF